ncbi:MAG TPA: helix-turn-helix domain-containing protein [Anaerolineales bacterium]|nr:helix-turn-helix domain-containing protein [Anaerolineales bacterium]
MFIFFEDRPSDSPFIERVFRCRSERAGTFLSMAASYWTMVVTRVSGKTTFTLRGPETHATIADCPADGEWIGILFKLGTFMPKFPARMLMDRNDLTLPDATSRSFWLDSSAWEYPDFENAETFVGRLMHHELTRRDPLVEAALRGQLDTSSLRSAQRHFLKATGLTQHTMHQIQRVRYAMNLLMEGVPILDTVHQAGYFDQAHLTRSLRRFAGQTPAQIIHETQQLSFLYKTNLL